MNSHDNALKGIRVFEFEQQCTRVHDGSLGIRLSATNQIVMFDHKENAEHLRVDDYVIAVDGAPLRNERLGTALKRLAKENGEALAPVQLTISRAVEPRQDAAPVEPRQAAAPVEPREEAAPVEPS